MKLVLAEKPSVAQSIAKVLGATKREDGYLEGKTYVILSFHKITNKAACGQSYFLRGW